MLPQCFWTCDMRGNDSVWNTMKHIRQNPWNSLISNQWILVVLNVSIVMMSNVNCWIMTVHNHYILRLIYVHVKYTQISILPDVSIACYVEPCITFLSPVHLSARWPQVRMTQAKINKYNAFKHKSYSNRLIFTVKWTNFWKMQFLGSNECTLHPTADWERFSGMPNHANFITWHLWVTAGNCCLFTVLSCGSSNTHAAWGD